MSIAKDFTYDKRGLHHIFHLSGFSFCCLCIETIPNVISSKQLEAFENHLQSKNHKENLATLFQFCFFVPNIDWNDTKLLNIVENSEFDISSEIEDEDSYIIMQNNKLLCLICQEILPANNKNIRKVKTLTLHLQSACHLDNVRDRVGWVCYPNVDDNFITLHRFSCYCSYCHDYIDISNQSLIQLVVDHVQNHLESQEVQKNKVRIDVIQHNTINCPDCGESIDIFENRDADFIVQNHIEKHQEFFLIDELEAPVFEEDAEFICLICKKSIMVFNRSVGISLNLHFTNYHGNSENKISDWEKREGNFDLLKRVFELLPSCFCVFLSYVTIQESYYFCRLCGCDFSLGNTFPFACESLLKHLLKYHYQSNPKPNLFVGKGGIVHYGPRKLKNIKNTKVEENMNENKKYLEIQADRGTYFCYLCEESISLEGLSDHVAKRVHVKKWITAETVSAGSSTKLYHRNDEINLPNWDHSLDDYVQEDIPGTCVINCVLLNKLFSYIPDDLKVHERFIKVNMDDLVCTLCRMTFETSFSIHADCKTIDRHVSEYSRENKNMEYETELKTLFNVTFFKSFDIKIQQNIQNNAMFLSKIDKTYICRLCKILVGGKSKKPNFVMKLFSHFNGEKHNKNLENLHTNKDFHQRFIGVCKDALTCELCKCQIARLSSHFSAANIVKTHVLEEIHINQYKAVLDSTAVEFNTRDLVERKGKRLFCHLCLSTFFGGDKSLNLHCKGKKHTQRLMSVKS